MQVQNPVIVICVAVCLLAVVAFILFGGSKESAPVEKRFVEHLGSNPEKAMQICLNETPFSTGGGEGAFLYAHPCLLQVACKAKPVNYTMAVKVCQAMEQVLPQEGDQDISGQKCVSYIDGNC